MLFCSFALRVGGIGFLQNLSIRVKQFLLTIRLFAFLQIFYVSRKIYEFGSSNYYAATGGLSGSSPRPFRLRFNCLRAFPCNPWRVSVNEFLPYSNCSLKIQLSSSDWSPKLDLKSEAWYELRSLIWSSELLLNCTDRTHLYADFEITDSNYSFRIRHQIMQFRLWIFVFTTVFAPCFIRFKRL